MSNSYCHYLRFVLLTEEAEEIFMNEENIVSKTGLDEFKQLLYLNASNIPLVIVRKITYAYE